MSVYLVGAYAVFWICTFIFILLLWVRQRRIDQRLHGLEDQLEQNQADD